MAKAVIATSFGDTGSSQHGASPDVKVNEVVTYRITITLPEGESRNLTITDLLSDIVAAGTADGSLAYVAGSAQVVATMLSSAIAACGAAAASR